MPTPLQLARRLDGVSESATLKLNATVQAMKAKGIDVVNLTAGEPDFNVPEAAKKAVIDAVNANKSKYTPAAGIPELRQAVDDKTTAKQPWKASNVVLTNGGKQSIFNAILALIDPGDEVLIPAPYWLSYPEIVRIAGGTPKFIPAPLSQGFKITPAQLAKALAPGHRVKMVIFNSPSNPTGAMYTREEFAALGRILSETPGAEGVWVLSDEIYDRIVFGHTPFVSFLDAAPQLRDRTITSNGMSKSAAMTGWRVGWSVAPDLVTQGMITLQGQSTSNVNALAQWASVAALKLPEADFAYQIESFKKRRDLCLDILKASGKIEVFSPEGAFYMFAGVGKSLKPGEDSMGFAERLLEGAQVAVVPGTPFGEPSFVRLSIATEEKALREGCQRISKFCS